MPIAELFPACRLTESDCLLYVSFLPIIAYAPVTPIQDATLSRQGCNPIAKQQDS